ncbi:hypothetical protein [Halorussus halophilus]|nr:hypothetical protein [Halorussus halophilus]
MSQEWGEYQTVFCSNGWIEIRDQADTDGRWIATDTPVEVER